MDLFLYSCFVSVSLSCLLTASLWSPALFVLLYEMFSCCFFVIFPCDVLGQVWFLIVSIPDLCLLPYFNFLINSSKQITDLLAATFCPSTAFANSLDPDQDRRNVHPDVDPNFLTL